LNVILHIFDVSPIRRRRTANASESVGKLHKIAISQAKDGGNFRFGSHKYLKIRTTTSPDSTAKRSLFLLLQRDECFRVASGFPDELL
jgi:hypothetical protein